MLNPNLVSILFQDQQLRSTMPLCSYGQTSLRFWYLHPLVHAVVILTKKLGVTEDIRERAGVKVLKVSPRNVSFFTPLATFHGQLSLCFDEVEQQKLFLLVKKNYHPRRKCRRMIILTKHFPFLSPNFIRESTVIVILHNVQL